MTIQPPVIARSILFCHCEEHPFLSLRGASFSVIARSGSDEAIYADSPSPGGRELEGGGNSPSPYSSPLKGEETFPEIASLRSQ